MEMAKQLVASYQFPVALSSPRNTSFIASLQQTPADRKHLLPGGSNQIPSASHRQTPSQPNSLDRCRSDLCPQPVARADTHNYRYLLTIQLQTTLSSVGSSVGVVTNCSLDDTKSGFNPRRR